MKDLFCKLFKNDKSKETATEIEKTESKETATEIEKTESKEWIWVEGYKGTNSDMTCNDYQYELGKIHIMPPDEDIVECSSGFHLCLTLDDVFEYYSIGNNNRFFKVKALVRKNDYEKYGEYDFDFYSLHKRNKLVSKSIEFISECTIDEILSGYNTETWTDEDKQRALLVSPESIEQEVIHRTRVKELVNHGYSVAFSEYIANFDDKFIKACTVASQPGVSMDVKVLTIFCGND